MAIVCRLTVAAADNNGAKISPQILKDLGRIRVRYQRIYYGKLLTRSSKADKAARYLKYERVSSVSEKTLKGQSIGNTIA